MSSGMHRLDDIEPDPVARLGDPPRRCRRARAGTIVRLRRLGRDGEAHEDQAHHDERDLLQPDPPRRRPEPSPGAAPQSPERVDVQDQQAPPAGSPPPPWTAAPPRTGRTSPPASPTAAEARRRRHGDRRGPPAWRTGRRADTAGTRPRPRPRPAAGAPRTGRSPAPRRRPAPTACSRKRSGRHRTSKVHRQDIQDDGVGGVEEQAGQVVTTGVDPEEDILHLEEQPGQGLVNAEPGTWSRPTSPGPSPDHGNRGS